MGQRLGLGGANGSDPQHSTCTEDTIQEVATCLTGQASKLSNP